MAKRRHPTSDELRQLLAYDPKLGTLTWKPRTGKWSTRWNSRYAGKLAGTLTPEGYIVLKIFDTNFSAHRVIWAMVYGAWPECIDHKNGRRADNRLRNLRAVSRSINQRNQKQHVSNTSGVTGVSWNRFTNKWVAAIRANNQTNYLGSYSDKADAVDARKRAEKAMHFTGRV